MRHPAMIALFALALGLAAPAQAQTEAGPDAAPADVGQSSPVADPSLSLGEPVGGDGVGEPYVGAEFGDWQLRCVRTGTDDDPCQLYQLLADEQGNSVAEISVFPLPPGQQAEAGVTIITPLETLLTENIMLRVDEGQAKRYPFTFCAAVGCVSRIGLVPEEVEAFRRGVAATARIVPAAAPDQEVLLTISLRGFTAGFQTLKDGVAQAAGE